MATPGASPYASKDPSAHASELGRVTPEDVHEFYAPFTMVDDVVELVRVISPGYGEMDMAVLVYHPRPLHVYTNSDAGERFLRERFPKVKRHRLKETDFQLEELDRGQAIAATLRSTEGPLRALSLIVRARPDSTYAVERYGSDGVWESDFLCRGIDMRVAATAQGFAEWEGKPRQLIDGKATLFRGSYGLVRPKPTAAAARRNTR
jgi:hypothetical protein